MNNHKGSAKINKKPKVSIILTSYNHERFIRHSIESVLNQTYSNFELIILDDHSSDNSWNIINEFKDKRIISVRNKTNQRLGNIRRAIEHYSSGELLAIHHSDDVWEPTKLEKQVRYMENHLDVGAVFSHAKIIDENDLPIISNNHPYYNKFNQANRSRFDWLRFFFYNGNVLCNPSSMRRKVCFMNIAPYYGFLQLPDFSFWVQFCFKHEIHILQEELIHFRVFSDNSNWSGNIPKNRIRIQFESLRILDHYKMISTKEELLKIFPEAKKYISEQYIDIFYALGMISLETGNNQTTYLFGLNLLFDALNDPNRSDKLKKFLGFDQKTFFELTAKYDVFSTEIIRKLQQELERKDQKILYYSLSKSWRFTRPLRKFFNLLEGRTNDQIS